MGEEFPPSAREEDSFAPLCFRKHCAPINESNKKDDSQKVRDKQTELVTLFYTKRVFTFR
jgi:hypothetical protein